MAAPGTPHPESLRLKAKTVLRHVRNVLGLSPMQKVLRAIERRGIDVQTMDVLEAFAGRGHMHVIDYRSRVKSIDLWDHDEANARELLSQYHDAVVKRVDSYEQVRREEKQFSMIILDPSPRNGPHYEVYDIFPDVFRLAGPRCVFVLTVIPTLNAALRRAYPETGGEDHLERRRAFYGVPHEQASNVPLAVMETAIRTMCERHGRLLEWIFLVRRNGFVSYLVFSCAALGARGESGIKKD